MKAPTIQGEKIYLRPLTAADAPRMTAWLNNPELTQYLTVEPPFTENQEREWVVSMEQSRTDLVFGVVAKDTNEHVGNIGLHHIDTGSRTAPIGIFIGAADMRGKGYGAEAVRLVVDYAHDKLKLDTIHSDIFAFNERSVALFSNAGFVRSEVRKDAHVKEGKSIDAVIYTYKCS
ncbi:MAG: GNAT family N-acetyltransferase [bacterium]|nr:GNAT family N-acetyltransferase [bacterium]